MRRGQRIYRQWRQLRRRAARILLSLRIISYGVVDVTNIAPLSTPVVRTFNIELPSEKAKQGHELGEDERAAGGDSIAEYLASMTQGLGDPNGGDLGCNLP